MPESHKYKETKEDFTKSLVKYLRILNENFNPSDIHEINDFKDDAIYKEIVKYLLEERKILISHLSLVHKVILKLLIKKLI